MAVIPSSPINIGLPVEPDVKDVALCREFKTVYDAIKILQRELDKANERIAVLEQYNIDFP